VTPENVFHNYRGYKFYYNGDIKFERGTFIIHHPPYIEQRERQWYYKLSVKLNDAQIHALFTVGFFFNPRAYITQLVTPEAQRAGLLFAGRAENGDTLWQQDLYELRKRLDDVDAWLYGERDESGTRAMMPGCLQEVIAGIFPLDLATALLLIPQPDLQFDWSSYWTQQPQHGLGPQPWIARLRCADQLIAYHRQWRFAAHTLATEFWHSLQAESLAPVTVDVTPSLF
jgi:hypothetical protein